LEGYSEDVLIYSYVNITEENNKYLYVSKVVDFSPNTSQSVETTIFESQTLLHFKMKRINNIFIRYLIGEQSLEIYLTYENSKFIFKRVSDNLRNEKLHNFKSYENLFYYNNEYIFHLIPTDLETKKIYKLFVSNSFVNSELIFIVENKTIDKISGFYDKSNGKFIYIYQYSNIIEYFILESKCLINTWHLDENNTIVCHDYKDYCMSNQYYYHYNTRECDLGGCKENYYSFNFECYFESCPTNTKSSSVNNYECESNLDYCHIDKNYKTTCFNGLNNEGFQYESTKIYFDSCGDSVYFYNNKTYLYKKVCLRECPTLTYSNDTSGKCECLYNKYYLDSNKTDYYECLKENETCIENNTKYEISDPNECFDTEENCIGRDFKIFNKLCLIECPINTIIDGNYCICQYHYYINDKGLNCFEEQKSCEDIKYPVTSNTNQCFLSSIDCIEKGNKFFNQVCYINNCPENTNDEYNNGTCYCTYFYFYNADTDLYNCFGENEVCENKGYSVKCNERKQCFNSLEDCKKNELKIFNNECYISCPDNTNEKNNERVCICSYYFYKSDNGLYTCLSENETCEEKGYMYKNVEIK